MSFKEIADALNAMPETEAQKARFAFHVGKGKPMDDIDRCITITCRALRLELPEEIAAEVERLWRESVAILREENDRLRQQVIALSTPQKLDTDWSEVVKITRGWTPPEDR